MKKLFTRITALFAACALFGSNSASISQTVFADSGVNTAKHYILPIENGVDINEWVTTRLEDKELEVRNLENLILDDYNGDIRQMTIPVVLRHCGIDADCIQRSEYPDSITYTIDINEDWNLEWSLAPEFGNSATDGARYVLQHFNSAEQRTGFIQITTGAKIVFSTCDYAETTVFDHRPFQDGELPKVVIAEGDYSANSFEIAMTLLLCDAIYHEAETTAMFRQSQSENETMVATYDQAFEHLDLAVCSNVIDNMLDNGTDIRHITAGDALIPTVQGKTIDVNQYGDGNIRFTVRDGLCYVDVTFEDHGAYERPLAKIELRSRYNGCSYGATVESFMDITTKKLRVTIQTDEQIVKEYTIPEYHCNNYMLDVPNNNHISAETLSIVSTLLNMEQ